MYPVDGDKCFMKPTVHVWCRKMLGVRYLCRIPRCSRSSVL